MKAASIIWNVKDTFQAGKAEAFVDHFKSCIKSATAEGIDILVFPALTGCFYQWLKQPCNNAVCTNVFSDSKEFIEMASELSLQYKIILCPGSYWEREGDQVFHTSCLITNGSIQLKQRQLYLSRWEHQAGLARGTSISMHEIAGWKLGIILSTDVFYPQVSRYLAINGADIVLSPVAITGEKHNTLQSTGMWQETQLNGFFSVESGFNGKLFGKNFWSASFINAPLEMTAGKDGHLATCGSNSLFMTAELDNNKRKKAISKFDALSMINLEFCRSLDSWGRCTDR
jgi:Predicted amidohydrolase